MSEINVDQLSIEIRKITAQNLETNKKILEKQGEIVQLKKKNRELEKNLESSRQHSSSMSGGETNSKMDTNFRKLQSLTASLYAANKCLSQQLKKYSASSSSGYGSATRRRKRRN